MSRPVCPQCGSLNVVPSLARNSHDNCVSCGHTDFVVRFHEPEATVRPRVEPVAVTKGEAEETPRRPRYWWQED